MIHYHVNRFLTDQALPIGESVDRLAVNQLSMNVDALSNEQAWVGERFHEAGSRRGKLKLKGD